MAKVLCASEPGHMLQWLSRKSGACCVLLRMPVKSISWCLGLVVLSTACHRAALLLQCRTPNKGSVRCGLDSWDRPPQHTCLVPCGSTRRRHRPHCFLCVGMPEHATSTAVKPYGRSLKYCWSKGTNTSIFVSDSEAYTGRTAAICEQRVADL